MSNITAELRIENAKLKARVAELEETLSFERAERSGGVAPAQELEFPWAWNLTRTEASLMAALFRARGAASNEFLHSSMYGLEGGESPHDKIVQVYICRIRKKLEPHFPGKVQTSPNVSARSGSILTHWGRGFYLSPECRAAISAHQVKRNAEGRSTPPMLKVA